jgi:sphingomyelin phosphodiesterase
VDYVAILGDLISHNDWEISEDDKIKNNQFIMDQIRETFWDGKDFETRDPSLPNIIPVVGNHEGIPVNYENYDDPNGFMHSKIFKGFDKLIPQDKIDKLTSQAFYTYMDTERKIKFISLDSNINSLFNMHASISPTNPLNILKNLAKNIYDSEVNGEKVVILTHIALGDYTAQTVFVKFFRVLLERFKDTITTSLAAHTHKDQFKFYKNDVGENFMIEYISPSLTTYADLNPGYRIYKFSGDGEVLDYDQYRFNIDVMNILAQQGNYTFNFDLSYSLLDAYEMQANTRFGNFILFL